MCVQKQSCEHVSVRTPVDFRSHDFSISFTRGSGQGVPKDVPNKGIFKRHRLLYGVTL
jgi:hypothetical protein